MGFIYNGDYSYMPHFPDIFQLAVQAKLCIAALKLRF